MTCGWWIRWYHRRQRQADVEIMWLSLLARAETEAEARVAWDLFLCQPGQEHWHCTCGAPITLLFRTVMFAVDDHA